MENAYAESADHKLYAKKIVYPNLTKAKLDDLVDRLVKSMRKKYSEQYRKLKKKSNRQNIICLAFVVPDLMCMFALVVSVVWVLKTGFFDNKLTLPGFLLLLIIFVSALVWILHKMLFDAYDETRREIEQIEDEVCRTVFRLGFNMFSSESENLLYSTSPVILRGGLYKELSCIESLKTGGFDLYEIAKVDGTSTVNVRLAGIINGFTIYNTEFSLNIAEFKSFTEYINDDTLDFTYLDDHAAELRKEIKKL